MQVVPPVITSVMSESIESRRN